MTLIGKGLTAEVFQYTDSTVLKLFNPGYPEEAVRREYENARVVTSLGVRAPAVHEMTEQDGRLGIVYDYARGRSMEAVFNEQQDLEFYLSQFCTIQNSFFQHTEPSLLSYKQYGAFLVQLRISDAAEAGRYLQFINSFPESDTVVHGDYHPLNVLVESKDCINVIDFMNVMRAPKEYDIARTFYLIATNAKDFAGAYLAAMGYTESDIADYIELVRLFRNLEG